MTSERELMLAHIEALFTHDAAGRMVRVNEPGEGGGAAPRFFVGRTAGGAVWRVRGDVGEHDARDLEALVTAEAGGDELLRPPYGAAAYAAVLARSAPVQRVWAGPAYRFPQTLPAAPDDAVLLVTAERIDVVRPHFPEWVDDVALGQPFMALVSDGRAVSLCCSVRITPTAHEAGVETHPDFRGRGHAARVVAAWARAVRALGCPPLYSTSWENAASQAVAAKLGLVRYGADLHIT